jgi:hypothetical protein
MEDGQCSDNRREYYRTQVNGNIPVVLRIKFVSIQEMKEMSLTATSTEVSSPLETFDCTRDFQEMFSSFSVGISAYLMAKMWDVELQK